MKRNWGQAKGVEAARAIPEMRCTGLRDLWLSEAKEREECRLNPVIPMIATEETDFHDPLTGGQEEESKLGGRRLLSTVSSGRLRAGGGGGMNRWLRSSHSKARSH